MVLMNKQRKTNKCVTSEIEEKNKNKSIECLNKAEQMRRRRAGRTAQTQGQTQRNGELLLWEK